MRFLILGFVFLKCQIAFDKKQNTIYIDLVVYRVVDDPNLNFDWKRRML